MNSRLGALKINLLIYGISILGFISEWVAVLSLKIEGAEEKFYRVKGYLSSLNLDLFNENNDLHLNWYNVLCYALLLLGGILYFDSAQEESRLVRFVFSIVFFQNLCVGIWNLIFILQNFTSLQEHAWLTYSIFLFLKQVLLVFSTYYALLYLQKNVDIDAAFGETREGSSLFIPNETPKWKRSLNLLFDTLVFFFAFSFMIFPFQASYMKIDEDYSNREMVLFFFIVFRLLYYPIFEAIFQASPGKFLTASRVVNEDGSKMNWETAIKRTLLRMIPFQWLSFLFSPKGWHDKYSNTLVVAEVNNSEGAIFRILFPLAMLGIILGHYGNEKYEDRKIYVANQIEHNQYIKELKKQIENIAVQDVIELEDVPKAYLEETLRGTSLTGQLLGFAPKIEEEQPLPEGKLYLIVEEVDSDSISAVLLSLPYKLADRYATTRLQQIYHREKEKLPSYRIDKYSLNFTYTTDYNKEIGWEKTATRLLGGQTYFQIKKIDHLFEIRLELGYTRSSSEGDVSFELNNYGWPLQLIAIEPVQGPVKWITQVPLAIPSIEPNARLEGTNFKLKEGFTLKIVTIDTTHQKHNFLIKYNEDVHSIEPLK